MKFTPKAINMNWDISPYTGLTRENWLDAAEYLLEGIFRHIKDYESPVVVPRIETEITYPHKNSSPENHRSEVKAEIFEGLARSFFIASSLIHCKPDIEIAGFNLRNYYSHQVLRICTPGDEYYAGSYEELQDITRHENPFRAFQQTVETCALVICLWACKEEIWDRYTPQEKDTIAAFLSSFAHANTVPQNWRLFNMLDMAFLNMVGYPIDKEIMADHAQAILEYYAGDGWYRDGQSFDYYSCWAFNFYAPLWNVWYGYEHMPLVAMRFEEYSNRLMATYPDFFDEDGFTNMWGRSCIYRFASISAFDGNMFLKNSSVNPGVARRIASGSLLQFLGRDDLLVDGIPTMGFYRQFAPLVQGYSCTESPFWLGKAFLCLHLDENHPFWTAKESSGSWETLGQSEVKETALAGPGLCFTNHKANGETILRTAKIVKHKTDRHGMWNYSKLMYNSKYPWEAEPVFDTAESGVKAGQVESLQYVITDVTSKKSLRGNATFWAGVRDNVLYRKQCFDYETETETHWNQIVYLADFAVPYGIIRADKLKLHRRPVLITLGSYGFADNGTEVTYLEEGKFKAVVLKGKDHTGRKREMAVTIFSGWSNMEVIKSTGTNPDSEKSMVVVLSSALDKQYGGAEPYLMISQIITRDDGKSFTRKDIFPVTDITFDDEYNSGCYGKTVITLTGSAHDESRSYTRTIDFNGIEGNLSL